MYISGICDERCAADDVGIFSRSVEVELAGRT
jgi:hypothetical protein